MGGIVGDYAYLLGNKIKSAGRLEDDSKENPRSPITDFDTKLIELFDNTPKKHRKFYKML